MQSSPRVLLVDPSDAERSSLSERLRLQGFRVTECRDGAEGAIEALEDAPAVVVADLSMPSISGVQLCRLLRSETATSRVPVVLRGTEGRRNHFWAEQAGAFAYVVKGHMGELVRALRRALEAQTQTDDDFFVISSTEGLDVRERIAAHLDTALFESVIAAEVRRLGTSESFERLLDLLSQFLSQVTSYRWMALKRDQPVGFGLHANPTCREQALAELFRVFQGDDASSHVFTVEDEDAVRDAEGPPPIIEPITFGEVTLGAFVVAPRAPVQQEDFVLARTVARELGGALRMATLVEESRLLARTDALTGLLNRRAFLEWAAREVRRADRYRDCLSVILLDVDHFKRINDERGHAGGDIALSGVARVLAGIVRACDVVVRWGGEEFVIALPSTSGDGAMRVAERARKELESSNILDADGARIAVTASFGVAEICAGETIEQLVDRADRAMYGAKTAGRNRVLLAEGPALAPPSSKRAVAEA